MVIGRGDNNGLARGQPVTATMAGESLEHYIAVEVDAAAIVGYQAELVLAAEG